MAIDSGTITQETNEGNMVFYRAIITMDNQQLVSNDGDIIKVIKSMPVIARIVYDKETYLDWLIEALNFSN